MKFFLHIIIFFALCPIPSFSQKPNKTIYDTVFEVGDIVKLPRSISCLGRELCSGSESKNIDSIKTTIDFINRQSNFIFQLQYHTDARGSVKNNLQLSRVRARTILRELKPLLKNPLQLTAEGLGESQPIVSQKEIDKIKDIYKKEDLYAINRRIVLAVIGKNK